MRKVAVFVEGQTELIIARDLIAKKFQWAVNFKCFNLVGHQYQHADFKHEPPDCEFYYQIVNVGNDERVLSVVLEQGQSLIDKGFERVIGLRDMYSKQYREKSIVIDKAINDRFKQVIASVIEASGLTDNIHFRHAIMETEAWFIGIDGLLEKVNGTFTQEFINNHAGFDVAANDPENKFFHPAGFLEALFATTGGKYEKKKGDIEAIASVASHEDYEYLCQTDKCASFNLFYDSLFVL